MKKKPTKLDLVKDIVYNYKTKYKQGFTNDEMLDILKSFPDITQDQLGESLGTRTCITIDNQTITYHSDLELALRCITQKRKPFNYEFD